MSHILPGGYSTVRRTVLEEPRPRVAAVVLTAYLPAAAAAAEVGIAVLAAGVADVADVASSLVKAETASLFEHKERVEKHRRVQEAAHGVRAKRCKQCLLQHLLSGGRRRERTPPPPAEQVLRLPGELLGGVCRPLRAVLRGLPRHDRRHVTGWHVAAGQRAQFDGFFGACSEKQQQCHPPDLQLPPRAYFVVNSGPCTVAEGGRCVGR